MKNILSCIATLLALALPAAAQEVDPGIFKIPPSAKVKIDRHNICRMVHNTTPSDTFMVGAGSASEWSSGPNAFLNVVIPGLNIMTCGPQPICPVATRNYTKVADVDPKYIAFSPDSSEFFALSFTVNESDLLIYGRKGNKWTQKQALPVEKGIGWGKLYGNSIGFSEDGRRAVILPTTYSAAPNQMKMLELNKNASGVWSVQQKILTLSHPATVINSVKFFGDTNDTVVFTWNVGSTDVPAASIIKRNASGAWSVQSSLPRPSLAINPIDVWLFGDGDRAYVTAEANPTNNNNFYPTWSADYKLANGKWSIVRTGSGAPRTLSADGLTGASFTYALILPGWEFSNSKAHLYTRSNPDQAFSLTHSLAVNNANCCSNMEMSADGSTIAANTFAALYPAATMVFNVVNGKLVNRGVPLPPVKTDFLMDWPKLSATGDVVFNNGQIAYGCSMP